MDGGSFLMLSFGVTMIVIGVMLIPIFIGIPIMLAGAWISIGAFKA